MSSLFSLKYMLLFGLLIGYILFFQVSIRSARSIVFLGRPRRLDKRPAFSWWQWLMLTVALAIAVAAVFLTIFYLPAARAATPRAFTDKLHSFRQNIMLTALAVDPTDGNALFVGTSAGYLYRSLDGGDTWEEFRLLPDDVPLMAVPLMELQTIYFPNLGLTDNLSYELPFYMQRYPANLDPRHFALKSAIKYPAIASSFELNVFGEFGFEEGLGHEHGHDVLARVETEDPGNLMAQYFRGIGAQPSQINWIDVCKTKPARVFAATHYGVFRSENRGQSWVTVFLGSSSDENQVWGVTCNPFDAELVYMASDGGFFYSQNGGISWSRPTDLFAQGALSKVVVDPKDHKRIYITGDFGVFYTDDLRTFHSLYWVNMPSADASFVIRFVHTGTPYLYVGSLDGTAASHDGGATWFRVTTNYLERFWGRGVAADPTDPKHVFFGTYSRLFESWDGGLTVEEINRTFTTDDLMMVFFHQQDPSKLWILTTQHLLLYGPEQPGQRPDPSDPLVADARRRLFEEPDLYATVSEAWRKNGLTYEQIMATRRRMLRSHLLPRVQVKFHYSPTVVDTSLVGIGQLNDIPALSPLWLKTCGRSGSPACGVREIDFGLAQRIDYWYAVVYATWDLWGLAYDSRLGGRLWVDIDSMRNVVGDEVRLAYLERFRLLDELTASIAPPDRRRAYAMRLEELTTLLNNITGGLFRPFDSLHYEEVNR